MTLPDLTSLGAFFGLCFTVALSGARFKPGEWYERLHHPSWRPPNWLFPIAWTILFSMIAVSGWMVWRATGLEGEGAVALGIYALQLALNAAWSWLFFGRHRMDWALAELVALWVAIAATIIAFAGISATAAWLLVPYLCWVAFAGLLNRKLVVLNPDAR